MLPLPPSLSFYSATVLVRGLLCRSLCLRLPLLLSLLWSLPLLFTGGLGCACGYASLSTTQSASAIDYPLSAESAESADVDTPFFHDDILRRLQAIQLTDGALFVVSQLDLTGDDVVDQKDSKLFRALSKLAKERLDISGLSAILSPLTGSLYQGVPRGPASVFSFIKQSVAGTVLTGVVDAEKTVGLNLDNVPHSRLPELYFESRWLTERTRILSIDKPYTIAGDHTPFTAALSDLSPILLGGEIAPNELCAVVRDIDVGYFLNNGLKPTAVFDLDGTVWAGNVADVFLLQVAALKLALPATNARLQEFLIAKGGADATQVNGNSVSQNALLLHRLATDKSIPHDKRISLRDSFYQTVGLLKGLTKAQVAAAAKALFLNPVGDYPAWQRLLFADTKSGCGMRDLIVLLKEQGITPYFLSATLHPVALEAAHLLGIDTARVIGSRLEMHEGIYTGEVQRSTYAIKAPIVRQWLPGPPLFVFGDSPTSDFPMLLDASVGAIMVNSRPQFIVRDHNDANGLFTEIWYSETEQGKLEPPNRVIKRPQNNQVTP